MGPGRDLVFLGMIFGNWIFPISLFLVVFATVFNLYDRFLRCISFRMYEFDSDLAEERLEDGRMIIEKFKDERFRATTVEADYAMNKSDTFEFNSASRVSDLEEKLQPNLAKLIISDDQTTPVGYKTNEVYASGDSKDSNFMIGDDSDLYSSMQSSVHMKSNITYSGGRGSIYD